MSGRIKAERYYREYDVCMAILHAARAISPPGLYVDAVHAMTDQLLKEAAPILLRRPMAAFSQVCEEKLQANDHRGEGGMRAYVASRGTARSEYSRAVLAAWEGD